MKTKFLKKLFSVSLLLMIFIAVSIFYFKESKEKREHHKEKLKFESILSKPDFHRSNFYLEFVHNYNIINHKNDYSIHYQKY